MHTQTNIPLAPQELKEREGVDFSTDLSPSQSNSRQSQVCSNPNQSEMMMMSSHFFHIRALIRCRRTTVWGRQPVRFTWELVSHIQKQPGSPVWELLREKFCCPGALASTKHPHHHQLFTDSAVHPCAWLCVFTCQSVSPCVVTICSHRIFGETRFFRFSVRICFSSAWFFGYLQGKNAMLHLRTLHSWFTWNWALRAPQVEVF